MPRTELVILYMICFASTSLALMFFGRAALRCILLAKKKRERATLNTTLEAMRNQDVEIKYTPEFLDFMACDKAIKEMWMKISYHFWLGVFNFILSLIAVFFIYALN